MSETLYKAVSIGDLEQVKPLIRDINIDLVYQWACQLRQNHIVKHLVNEGVDVNICKNISLFCIENDNIDTLKFLVKNGLVIDEDSIIYAVRQGDISLVNYLLESGADINIKDGSPLVQATRKDDLVMIYHLFSKGANIHIRNDLPLQLAILLKKFNIIRLFIEQGADLMVALRELKEKINDEDTLELLSLYKWSIRLFKEKLNSSTELDCGICLQEMKSCEDRVIQCNQCKKCTHLDCYANWGKNCIYCRN